MEIQHTTTGFPHPHSSHCGYEIYCELVSDPPAVPRHKGDCAEELLLPMLPPGCFEAGRLTLTQSSWTARRCSRKWMSGQAEALVVRTIDDSSLIQPVTVPPRESTSPSERRTPSLLDFYLSWRPLLVVPFWSPFRQSNSGQCTVFSCCSATFCRTAIKNDSAFCDSASFETRYG